jgi:hypothetical protein
VCLLNWEHDWHLPTGTIATERRERTLKDPEVRTWSDFPALSELLNVEKKLKKKSPTIQPPMRQHLRTSSPSSDIDLRLETLLLSSDTAQHLLTPSSINAAVFSFHSLSCLLKQSATFKGLALA